MAAAAAGARAAGWRVVGLLPGSDPGAADPGVELALATGLGEMRNALLLRAAQAVIAIGGGVGTLSEIALALVLGKPIAGLDTWGLEPPSGSPGAALQLERVPSPERAVEWVLGRAGLGQGE